MPETFFSPLALQTYMMGLFYGARLFCISPFIIPPCGGGHHSYIIKCSFLLLALSFKADRTPASGPILSLLSLL